MHGGGRERVQHRDVRPLVRVRPSEGQPGILWGLQRDGAVQQRAEGVLRGQPLLGAPPQVSRAGPLLPQRGYPRWGHVRVRWRFQRHLWRHASMGFGHRCLGARCLFSSFFISINSAIVDQRLKSDLIKFRLCCPKLIVIAVPFAPSFAIHLFSSLPRLCLCIGPRQAVQLDLPAAPRFSPAIPRSWGGRGVLQPRAGEGAGEGAGEDGVATDGEIRALRGGAREDDVRVRRVHQRRHRLQRAVGVPLRRQLVAPAAAWRGGAQRGASGRVLPLGGGARGQHVRVRGVPLQGQRAAGVPLQHRHLVARAHAGQGAQAALRAPGGGQQAGDVRVGRPRRRHQPGRRVLL